MREKIACIGCDNNDICYGHNPVVNGESGGDVCSMNLQKADQILKYQIEGIKKAENPYDETDEQNGLWFHVGFEVARQKILKALESE
jgi:hypothetical protein